MNMFKPAKLQQFTRCCNILRQKYKYIVKYTNIFQNLLILNVTVSQEIITDLKRRVKNI